METLLSLPPLYKSKIMLTKKSLFKCLKKLNSELQPSNYTVQGFSSWGEFLIYNRISWIPFWL